METEIQHQDVPPDGGRAMQRPHLRLVASNESLVEEDLKAQLDVWMVAVAREQDRVAFTALFTHFAPKLKGWLWKTGSTDLEAEELTQEAFVMLWRKSGQFDPARAGVGSWLFTIARNLRVDRRRGVHEAWSAIGDEAHGVVDPGPGQEAIVDRRQHDERVRLAVATLTNDQRQLIQLSFYEDMSHSRIAARMGLPLGTVKTRLRRAAACLRMVLQGCEP